MFRLQIALFIYGVLAIFALASCSADSSASRPAAKTQSQSFALGLNPPPDFCAKPMQVTPTGKIAQDFSGCDCGFDPDATEESADPRFIASYSFSEEVPIICRPLNPQYALQSEATRFNKPVAESLATILNSASACVFDVIQSGETPPVWKSMSQSSFAQWVAEYCLEQTVAPMQAQLTKAGLLSDLTPSESFQINPWLECLAENQYSMSAAWVKDCNTWQSTKGASCSDDEFCRNASLNNGSGTNSALFLSCNSNSRTCEIPSSKPGSSCDSDADCYLDGDADFTCNLERKICDYMQ